MEFVSLVLAALAAVSVIAWMVIRSGYTANLVVAIRNLFQLRLALRRDPDDEDGDDGSSPMGSAEAQ